MNQMVHDKAVADTKDLGDQVQTKLDAMRAIVLDLAQRLGSDPKVPLSLIYVDGYWQLIDLAPLVRSVLGLELVDPLPKFDRTFVEHLHRRSGQARLIASQRDIEALAKWLYDLGVEAKSKAAVEAARAAAVELDLADSLARTRNILAAYGVKVAD